jgi:hypothetical protein
MLAALFKRWIGFSEDDASRRIAEGADNRAAKPHVVSIVALHLGIPVCA